MLIEVVSLFFLMRAAAEEPKPAREMKPRPGSYEDGEPGAPGDPFSGRHVAVTVYADPGKVSIQKVEVLPGAARAYLADSSRLRVRLLDARGNLLHEAGIPNPLSLRVYTRQGDGSIYPVETIEGPSAVPRPHDTFDLDEATLTIVLPLRPELTTVSLGWIDVGLVDQDVTKEIRGACAKDSSPACLAWMKTNP
jgi:hypothetical protein